MNSLKRVVTGDRTPDPPEWEIVDLNQVPDALFLQTHKLICESFPQLVGTSDRVGEIRCKIERGGLIGHAIDYEEEFLEFNRAYFFRNLYKCLCLLMLMYNNMSHIIANVVDLAAGAGPFALAANLIFRCKLERTMLVDKSAGQLSLARHIFNLMNLSSVEIKNLSLFEFAPPSTYYRLCSYWLCEDPVIRRALPEWTQTWLPPGALFIDYRDVLEEFSSYLDRSLFKCRLFSMVVKPTSEVARQLEQEHVSIHGLRVSPRNTC
jgi:hypothetical protein